MKELDEAISRGKGINSGRCLVDLFVNPSSGNLWDVSLVSSICKQKNRD